jgi:hypothetical protein
MHHLLGTAIKLIGSQAMNAAYWAEISDDMKAKRQDTVDYFAG